MVDTILNRLVASASDCFRHRWGGDPRWIAAAPGRVNIIGEHVDYNGGFVLPMAIDRYCVIAAADFHERERAIIHSVAQNAAAVIPLSVSTPHKNAVTGHWSNYVEGIIAGCAERGMRSTGFKAVIESNVPVGGGLSSSAAIEVATATLIEAMTGIRLDPIAKALLCQQAEHDYAGVPCGIMDQFASVMCRPDHLMLLDCRSQQIEHIPFLDPNITVLIINTNVKHELTGGEYAAQRAQCESAARKLDVATLRDASPSHLESCRNELTGAEYCRARHLISEIARTVEAAAAVKSGDWPRVGTAHVRQPRIASR